MPASSAGITQVGFGVRRQRTYCRLRACFLAAAPRRQWRMTATQAWLVLLVFYAAPLLHVALSPKSGPLRPPPGSRSPFGPRSGWLVIVLLLGPVGWLLYMRARGRARAHQAPPPTSDGPPCFREYFSITARRCLYARVTVLTAGTG